MFMDEEDKLLDVAVRESDYLHDHGLFGASRIIDQLFKQRAELLEVLKLADRKIVKMYDGITCGCGEDYAKIDEDSIAIREAITKAEEAE